jgi:hypothetical protein
MCESESERKETYDIEYENRDNRTKRERDIEAQTSGLNAKSAHKKRRTRQVLNR